MTTLAVTTAPAHLGHLAQGFLAGQHPDTTWAEYRDTIEHAINHQPRSLQTRIGPSELGNPCDRCLILKLAGAPERHDVAWLPFIGTAVHEQLGLIFTQANADKPAGLIRWLVESHVSVGVVGGQDITGHADLFDVWTGDLTDWKVVGATTLRDAKANGPATTYRTQAHLYGHGFSRRGLTVNRVRIAYLPRNEPSLANAHIWSEPYNQTTATAAVARADMFATALTAYGLDGLLHQLPPHTGREHSCSRYDDGPPSRRDGHPTTASLLNLTT